MDLRELASDLMKRARSAGADAADVIAARGNDFSVTVRLGEVETLEQAGSKALGLRVFVGKRSALTYTSDFSPAALAALVDDTVAMARVTGEDAAAGLPDQWSPAEDVELGMFDASPETLPTEGRIEWARRAEKAAMALSPEIDNSSGATFGAGDDTVVLANSEGFLGSYRTSSVSGSVVPVAQRDGEMQRDYWYTAGRGLGDLLTPEEVGRIAGERTVRRLGSRQVPTCEAPVVLW